MGRVHLRCVQASLKSLHESGELSPEDIVEAHSEGITNIEKAVRERVGSHQFRRNRALLTHVLCWCSSMRSTGLRRMT